MASILRFSSSDERIKYSTGWISNSGMNQNGTYSLATFYANLFFLFRGTSVRFYGRIGGGGGSLSFVLDVNSTDLPLNGTNLDDEPKLVWGADHLGDGDHQLFMEVASPQRYGSVAVDYFEVENSSGNGFDLLWAGPNATNVPEEAIIVDDSSPDVIVDDPFRWAIAINSPYDYNGGKLYTEQAGASLNFSFDGVAIWYYSPLGPDAGFCIVSIDGSEPERLNGKNDGGQLNQRMLWSKTNLTPGEHTFVLKQDGPNGTSTSLDFFRVLRANDASALPSNTSTSQGVITPESKSNIVPLAVGLILGLLTLSIAVFGAFYLWRREPAPVKAPSMTSLKP